MSAQENPVFRFGAFELDPTERRLLGHGQTIVLTPKVFDTLVLLVEHADHVVSKDLLMATLWPRGFVHESNLTKHIWLIRKALGEGEGESESRYIETLPKLGYRFVAPVRRMVRVGESADTALTESAPATTAAAAPVSPSRERHAAWTSIAGLLALALIAFAAWRWHAASRAGDALAAPDNSAIAIVDFNNLSQNAKDAWLAPALEEMLATEIAAGGTLHAVPDELVRPARADLPGPAAGGYASGSLTALRKRLGARYVLSGAYFVSSAADAPMLRIDLAVQDAASGKSLVALSRTGPVAELPQLIAQTGATLRDRFGVQPTSANDIKLLANAQPPSAEVARRIGFALDALDKYDPARARDELLQAVAQAPGYAPAYAYLAQAWSALGYRAKALAALGQASADAQDLPEEQRLQIQAQHAALRSDWPHAIAAYRKLVALRPHNSDYPLAVIGALVSAGKADDADAVLVQLRKLPGVEVDPRIELAEVRIASARNDDKARLAHARLALQQAQTRGESGLMAGAELQLGIASGGSAQAEPLLRKAAADYRKLGNPHGEALAYQNLANLFFDSNRVQAARETYQRAMGIYQGIGDLGGVAAIYDNLTRMLWAAGDRDGAEAAVREALKIGRETDDLARQAWSLTGLATILSDESASDEVSRMYQQAIALDEQAGEKVHQAFALAEYADLLRQRGELDHARDICAQAQHEAKALGDADSMRKANFQCAQIALDRGEVDTAAASLKEIARQALAASDTFDAANAQMMLGQIAIGRQRWAEARDALQTALKGWRTNQETAGQAVSEALLANCYASLGEATARDNAATQARELRSRVNQHAEIVPADIALAILQGRTGARDAAVAVLRALADDADKRLWMGIAMEARLAAVQLMERGGDFLAAKTLGNELETKARQHGYGWVLARLHSVPSNQGSAKLATDGQHATSWR